MSVNQENLLNDLLVMLFNEILDVEQKALITGTFKEISINDMHIIDAIGIGEPKNMSTVAGEMAVTVGTLTTAINNLVKDRTTLIVAHRLSTIRDADKIAVIGHGGLEEFGTYEELMAKKGKFYELKELQM